MSINSAIDVSGSAYGLQATPRSQVATHIATENTSNGVDQSVTAPDQIEKKPAKLQDVQKITVAMNQFVESIGVNIRFKTHQKTNELMVQFVDQTNNRVIKEFPSQTFLDTIAAIRDYVGLLIDKKI